MENPTFDTFAKLFKEKANGKHIFPKLPTILKSYYMTWETNSGIKSTEQALDLPVNALLTNLFNTRTLLTTGEILP